jgi:hypothetical protein
MTDERFLIASLHQMGYQVEKPTSSSGAGGSTLHRTTSSFARTGDGRFVAVLSEYDRQIGYNDAWLGRVQPIYKEKQVIAVSVRQVNDVPAPMQLSLLCELKLKAQPGFEPFAGEEFQPLVLSEPERAL